jgi:hypothetical protein
MHDVDHLEAVCEQPFLDLDGEKEFILDDQHAPRRTDGVAGAPLCPIRVLRPLGIHARAHLLRD